MTWVVEYRIPLHNTRGTAMSEPRQRSFADKRRAERFAAGVETAYGKVLALREEADGAEVQRG